MHVAIDGRNARSDFGGLTTLSEPIALLGT